jgi:uncharacterized protein DUF4238
MTGQLSRRHHYIPRFLIKNFSDQNNMLWVYNKQERKIISKQQSPKSIFFEWDRNLFDINGQPGDNIEKMYGEVDDMLSKTLKHILATHNMTGRELTLMIYLVSLMKWRIPKVDDSAKELVRDLSIENLGIAVRPVDPTQKADPEDLNKIDQADIIGETKRLLLSVQPLLNPQVLDEIHSNCFITSYDEFPALLGDCPIIEEDYTDFKTLGNFIFPLSTTDTLICKRGAERYIPTRMFYIQKDLNVFHLSEKYVACRSREQLENIVTMYRQLKEKGNLHFLKRSVFDSIS